MRISGYAGREGSTDAIPCRRAWLFERIHHAEHLLKMRGHCNDELERRAVLRMAWFVYHERRLELRIGAELPAAHEEPTAEFFRLSYQSVGQVGIRLLTGVRD